MSLVPKTYHFISKSGKRNTIRQPEIIRWVHYTQKYFLFTKYICPCRFLAWAFSEENIRACECDSHFYPWIWITCKSEAFKIIRGTDLQKAFIIKQHTIYTISINLKLVFRLLLGFEVLKLQLWEKIVIPLDYFNISRFPYE